MVQVSLPVETWGFSAPLALWSTQLRARFLRRGQGLGSWSSEKNEALRVRDLNANPWFFDGPGPWFPHLVNEWIGTRASGFVGTSQWCLTLSHSYGCSELASTGFCCRWGQDQGDNWGLLGILAKFIWRRQLRVYMSLWTGAYPHPFVVSGWDRAVFMVRVWHRLCSVQKMPPLRLCVF